MYDNLTKSDIEKMQEEIEYRKLVVRKEALEAVKEARAHGDLSENFEYKAAKQDKNRNESRIRYLEKMIKTARIISDESKDNEVGLGDTLGKAIRRHKVGDRVHVKVDDRFGYDVEIRAIDKSTGGEDDKLRGF